MSPGESVSVESSPDPETVPSAERDGNDSRPALPPDDRFHVLQTKRRRDSLRYLRRTDGRVDVRDLAEWVAAREHETTPEGLTSRQRQRVYISLYQTHLPKLDEYGIVRYDKDRGTVEPTPLVDHFAEYLDPPTTENRRTWWRPYLALTGVAAVAFGLLVIDVLPFSPTAITALVISSFACLSIVHAASEAGETGRLDALREQTE